MPIKIDYLFVLTDPLAQKFHAYSKTDLKISIKYQNGIDFWIELQREMTIQNFKLYWESWPKFEHVIKKKTALRTLESLAFDE